MTSEPSAAAPSLAFAVSTAGADSGAAESGASKTAAAAAREAELVARARTDSRAFAELYRAHYAAIGRYLLRRTGDAHATEDLLSEVFLSALRGIHRYRSRGAPFRAWLYRIATNAANRWSRRTPRASALETAAHVADPSADGRAPSVTAEQRDALRAMRLLSPRHQAVLALHYVEGLAISEIAAVLRCPEGSVKSRLSRARAALAKHLDSPH